MVGAEQRLEARLKCEEVLRPLFAGEFRVALDRNVAITLISVAPHGPAVHAPYQIKRKDKAALTDTVVYS